MDIHKLFDTKRLRLRKRLEMFTHILEKCHDKIKKAGYLEHTHCVYVIPPIIVGMPMYKINDCKEYIISSLTANGFQVDEIEGRYDHILISWKHHDEM